MGYVVWFTDKGIRIIDGVDVVSPGNATAAAKGVFEISKGAADDVAPIVDGAFDVDASKDPVQSADPADWSNFTKEAVGSTLGLLAGLAALPLGPTASLIADQAISKAYGEAHDAASNWSRNRDWPPLFEALEEIALGAELVSDDIMDKLRALFNKTQLTISPLVLDLDGINGTETINQSEGVHFDHDANQFAEQSGWVGKNDGLLVWDRNTNGQIDDGAELFGNHTVLANGQKAARGACRAGRTVRRRHGRCGQYHCGRQPIRFGCRS